MAPVGGSRELGLADFARLQRLAATGSTARLFREFEAAGIRLLLLKGLSLQRWLYADGAPRPSGDLDLLVSPADFEHAERLLTRLGFVSRHDGAAPAWAQEHADSWQSLEWPLPIDLHRRLWGIEEHPQVAFDLLWAAHASIEVGGQPVQILGEAARALLVALHVAHHGTGFSRPMEDLRRAIAQVPSETWADARQTAEEVGALASLSLGLSLVASGSALRQQLGLTDARAPNATETPLAWTLPMTGEGFVRIRRAQSLGEKLRLLRREAVPSIAFMRVQSAEQALARRGRRGLTLAYTVRVVRLLRHVKPGLRAARDEYGSARPDGR